MTEKEELIKKVKALKVFKGEPDNLTIAQLEELLFFAESASEQPASEGQVKQFEEELDKVNTELADKQSELNDSEEKNAQILTEHNEALAEIEKLKAEVANAPTNELSKKHVIEVKRARQAQMALRKEIESIAARLNATVKDL